MKIAVLTYDRPHRKTQDLCVRLKMYGYMDITIVQQEWIERPVHKPLIEHRILEPFQISNNKFAFMFGLKLIDYFPGCLNNYDTVLIGGAQLIDDVESGIINAHPGWLPTVRGLDALKWAILDGLPIGVTTHLISDEPDAGILIDQKLIELRPFDTFHSVALRQYLIEIDMLADAVSKCGQGIKLPTIGTVHKRMSHRDEMRMINRFNKMIATI